MDTFAHLHQNFYCLIHKILVGMSVMGEIALRVNKALMLFPMRERLH